MTEKILLFTTGQSNTVRRSANSNWFPSGRAFKWNNAISTPSSVGTAFEPLDPTGASIGEAIASVLAEAKPDAEVYVVTCGKGGLAVGSWLPGGSPDLFAAGKANVEAALTALGKTKIDRFIWWQGETGGELSSYQSDLTSVIARFRAESWMDADTPITIFGTTNAARGGDAKYDTINANLLAVAVAHGALFVPTWVFSGNASQLASYQIYWADALHPSSHGYVAIGQFAANLMLAQEKSFELNPFTPFVYGLTAVGSASYDARSGYFYQIGPVTFYTATVSWSGHTGSGPLCLGDQMPFLPPIHTVGDIMFQSGYSPDDGLCTRLDALGRRVVFDGKTAVSVPASGNLQFSGMFLSANA